MSNNSFRSLIDKLNQVSAPIARIPLKEAKKSVIVKKSHLMEDEALSNKRELPFSNLDTKKNDDNMGMNTFLNSLKITPRTEKEDNTTEVEVATEKSDIFQNELIQKLIKGGFKSLNLHQRNQALDLLKDHLSAPAEKNESAISESKAKLVMAAKNNKKSSKKMLKTIKESISPTQIANVFNGGNETEALSVINRLMSGSTDDMSEEDKDVAVELLREILPIIASEDIFERIAGEKTTSASVSPAPEAEEVNSEEAQA